MADRPETGIFLERRSYRRRRLIDGLKLLPFLGAWLFLLPVFWTGAGAEAPQSMSRALYYIFGVWLGLIVACAILVIAVRKLGSRAEALAADTDDPAREDAGGP